MFSVVFFVAVPLQIEVEAGVEGCPSADALVAETARHIEGDPAGGSLRAVVAFHRDERWHARVRVYDRNEALIGERTLSSRATDCRALAGSIALGLALAWHQATDRRPLVAKTMPATPSTGDHSLVLGAALSGGALVLPTASLGVAGQAGYQARRWAVRAGFIWQRSAPTANAGLVASVAAGAVSGCLLFLERFSACLDSYAGTLTTAADRAEGRPLPWLAMATRLAFDAAVSGPWRGVLFASVGWQSTARVFLDDRLLWQSLPVWLSFGLEADFVRRL